ncbi:hypothetical protein M0638_22150 [Roseomonas sp. NAR14]|uniref:Protein SCO1/2 n=1 Tax=Roseomonas acroporae TaxID=2937791 RepID=A0A9X1YJ31_9PROT|nr:hypothetical protein [Roseomonas acroporae]MCK8787081.1 hypothetical protein [Roseomonas acroporae]
MSHLRPAALALLLAATPAMAAPPGALADVALSPPPDARLPPDLALATEAGETGTPAQLLAGRPALLVLADYRCAVLCGTALGLADFALQRSGLRPGLDYMLLVLGIDPRDGPAEAAAAKRERLGDSPVAPSARFLTAAPEALAAAEAALGYRAWRDPETGEYAHPLGALVLAPDGRVSAVLDGLVPEPAALRAALAQAASAPPAGPVARLGERLRLLCAGFGLGDGFAVPLIRRVLGIGMAMTLLGLGGLLWALSRRRMGQGPGTVGRGKAGRA